MIQKIKEFFSSVAGVIMLVLTGVAGVALYLLGNKRKEVNALKAKADLAETQKQADLVEVEIKEHIATKATLDKEVKELEKGLDALAEKRKTLPQEESKKTSDEVEDFWKKN